MPDTQDIPAEPEPRPDEQLTEKQARFVEEFLLDMDKKKAAIRAGYSRRCAAEIGWENYQKPHVRAAIDRGIEARKIRTGIDIERVLGEMAILAFSDVGDVQVGDDGQVFFTIPEARRAVKKIKVQRAGAGENTVVETEVEFYNKQAALASLMNHLGLVMPELPPLENLLNRFPPNMAAILRKLMANPNLIKDAQAAKEARAAKERLDDRVPRDDAEGSAEGSKSGEEGSSDL